MVVGVGVRWVSMLESWEALGSQENRVLVQLRLGCSGDSGAKVQILDWVLVWGGWAAAWGRKNWVQIKGMVEGRERGM